MINVGNKNTFQIFGHKLPQYPPNRILLSWNFWFTSKLSCDDDDDHDDDDDDDDDDELFLWYDWPTKGV